MSTEPLSIAMVHRDLPITYNRGGVSYQVHYLANQLVGRGHAVTMFSLDAKPDDALYQVHQIRISHRLRTSKIFQSQVWPVHVARQDYSEFDVVHAHGDSHFLRSNGTPVLRTFHGSALAEALSANRLRRKISQLSTYPLELLSGRIADMPVAISYATARDFPFIDFVVPCGVDLEQFKPSPGKSPNPSILFVGMLDSRKRGQLLVAAFVDEVKPAIPDAELWLVCPEHIEKEGIVCSGNIPLDELVELYQQAWVFCLPSSYEGFGVPYIEALAAGTPVVTTPNVGASEVLENGKYGIICSDQNLGRVLVATILDSDLRDNLITRGLDHVEQFSWANIIPQYECIYRSLIEE